MTFYERLTDLMSENRISGRELAKKIGASPTATIAWRKGAVPNADAACKIAELLHTTVEYLVTGKISESRLPSDLYKFADLSKPNQNAVLTLINALYDQEEAAVKKNQGS